MVAGASAVRFGRGLMFAGVASQAVGGLVLGMQGDWQPFQRAGVQAFQLTLEAALGHIGSFRFPNSDVGVIDVATSVHDPLDATVDKLSGDDRCLAQ